MLPRAVTVEGLSQGMKVEGLRLKMVDEMLPKYRNDTSLSIDNQHTLSNTRKPISIRAVT